MKNFKFIQATIGGSRVNNDPTKYFNATPTKNILRLAGKSTAAMKVDFGKLNSEDGLYICMAEVQVPSGEVKAAIYLADGASFGEEGAPSSAAKLGVGGNRTSGSVSFSNSEMYAQLEGEPTMNTRWILGDVYTVNEAGDALELSSADKVEYGEPAFWTFTYKDKVPSSRSSSSDDEDDKEDAKAEAAASIPSVPSDTASQTSSNDDDLFA